MEVARDLVDDHRTLQVATLTNVLAQLRHGLLVVEDRRQQLRKEL
jgi:hypothetical protein